MAPKQEKCASCGAFLPASTGEGHVVRCGYCGAEARMSFITRLTSRFPAPPSARKSPVMAIITFFIVFTVVSAIAAIIIGVALSPGEPQYEDFHQPHQAPQHDPPPTTEVLLTQFVVEIQGAHQPQYVKASVALTLTDSQKVKLFYDRTELIRDAVKMILSEQDSRILLGPGGQTDLEDQILQGVEMIIDKGSVVHCELKEFSIQ